MNAAAAAANILGAPFGARTNARTRPVELAPRRARLGPRLCVHSAGEAARLPEKAAWESTRAALTPPAEDWGRPVHDRGWRDSPCAQEQEVRGHLGGKGREGKVGGAGGGAKETPAEEIARIRSAVRLWKVRLRDLIDTQVWPLNTVERSLESREGAAGLSSADPRNDSTCPCCWE